MNRKLWILNAALVGIAVYAGVQLRREWLAAKEREAATLRARMKPVAAPSYTPRPLEPPVTAAAYADIAEKMLFDKTRNPTVVIEPPPAPPPKPMPALPMYHGLLNIGGGTMAVLSLGDKAPHQFIHLGETIGQFKLVDVNSEEMTLEWDGQMVHKKVDELTAPAAVADASARTEVPSTPSAPPPAVKSGPGDVVPQGGRTCAMNDGNAEGAIVDGFRKVVYATPFGSSCLWQPTSK